ncbi:unnamed protein product [Adineta steineri]|uniref:Nuclear receptor domain-containing protein n=1 Tax=Adineta steineri TaxID=433720 RepID=A0A818SQR1_9BILA|nr:unnamed protein product [Adineta steineri]CAF3674566.1 unnamed protein product [Adineta steineri]
MWQEHQQTSTSPFDCAVCGACVYGNNSGIRTCLPCKSFFRRHAFLPSNTLKCNQNGTCNIEATRRYFSASLPPCRACRLQKCLEVGMDQNLLRPRSASSPPLTTVVERLFTTALIKTASLDENAVPSRLKKQIESESDTQINNDKTMIGRPRCSSDANDYPHHRF